MEFKAIHIKSEGGYFSFDLKDNSFTPISQEVQIDNEPVFAGYRFSLISNNFNIINAFRSPTAIDFILESDEFYYKNEKSMISGKIRPRFHDINTIEIIWYSKFYPYRVEKNKQILSELTN